MEYDSQQETKRRPTDPLFESNTSEQPTKWERTPWGWWWEILMTVVSMASMAAIVAILGAMRDRPLTDWHFFFGLSATLAIFSTTSNTAAASAVGSCISQGKWLHFLKPRKLADLDLIEEAAGGPYGAVMLLFKQPKTLVSLGAFVTIIALGYDTFIQQIVEFSPEDIFVDNATAILGLTHYYNGGADIVGALGGVINVSPMTADVQMQGAVYRGLFGLGSAPVLNCSTACEWPGTYATLGFAATCADVTTATLDAHGNASSVWSKEHYQGGLKDVGLTTPGGVLLDGSFSATSWQTIISIGSRRRMEGQRSATTGPPQTTLGAEIAGVAVLRIKSDTQNFRPQDPYKDMEIVECDIDLVAYRYTNVTYSAGQLTATNRELVRLQPGTLVQGRRGDSIYEVDFTQPGLPTLSARVPDLVAIEVLFNSTRFTGNIYDGLNPPIPPRGMGDAFRQGDMIRTLQAMADSMTDQLRSNLSDPAAVTGRSAQPVVFVRVRWAYLTLPAFVTIVSAMFTVLTIVKSGRVPELPLWMNSTTAALSYDVRFSEESGGTVGRLGTGIRTVGELERYSDGITAVLDLPEGAGRTYTVVEGAGSGGSNGNGCSGVKPGGDGFSS
ncbi:hypothetical protein VTJ49DRAFT_589 [Mycothermus thermophilus]|uniref:Uncharacterized protein n=1 Tax=Humicola insolens TaxID=85995 RepID=A0ABR3VEK4_HUMIN